MRKLTLDFEVSLKVFSVIIILSFVLSCSTSEHKGKANSLSNSFYKYKNGPGLAFLVMRNGEVVEKKGFGLANLNTREKITSRSRFRLASVSKALTAYSIYLLESKRVINRKDSIRKYFKDLPSIYEDVKVHHLLHHMSGLPDYMSLCSTNKETSPVDNDQVLKFLQKENKLDFKPGTKHQYSNTGYVVLSSLIQRATGKNFRNFVQENILKPAGINKAEIVEKPIPKVEHKVVSYGGWPYFSDIDFNSCNFISGDGGIYFSIDDFSKWISFLEKNKESHKKLFAKSKLNSGEEINYGYGWKEMKLSDHEFIGHTGGWLGFRTVVLFEPQKKYWFVILSNYSYFSIKEEIKKIVDYYL